MTELEFGKVGPPLPPGIGKPALRALAAAGFTQVEQLALVTEASLLQLHGVGPKAIWTLREALKEIGQSFAEARADRLACRSWHTSLTRRSTCLTHHRSRRPQLSRPRSSMSRFRADEIRNVMGPGYQEVMAAVAAQDIGSAGPWFTHHLRMDPEVFDFEIGVPVSGPVAPTGRVEAGQFPAATVARTVYHGGYEGLPDAWGEFEAWIAAEGLTTASDLWEVYAAGPESSDDPAEWRTELYRPLIR